MDGLLWDDLILYALGWFWFWFWGGSFSGGKVVGFDVRVEGKKEKRRGEQSGERGLRYKGRRGIEGWRLV